MSVAMHAQSTQTSLQYLSNTSRKMGKFDFLHEDKHQSFLQTDIVFGGNSQASTKYLNRLVLDVH